MYCLVSNTVHNYFISAIILCLHKCLAHGLCGLFPSRARGGFLQGCAGAHPCLLSEGTEVLEEGGWSGKQPGDVTAALLLAAITYHLHGSPINKGTPLSSGQSRGQSLFVASLSGNE